MFELLVPHRNGTGIMTCKLQGKDNPYRYLIVPAFMLIVMDMT